MYKTALNFNEHEESFALLLGAVVFYYQRIITTIKDLTLGFESDDLEPFVCPKMMFINKCLAQLRLQQFTDKKRELENSDNECINQFFKLLTSNDKDRCLAKNMVRFRQSLLRAVRLRNIILHADARVFSDYHDLVKQPRKNDNGNGVVISSEEIFDFVLACKEISFGLNQYYAGKDGFKKWLEDKFRDSDQSLFAQMKTFEEEIAAQDVYAIRG